MRLPVPPVLTQDENGDAIEDGSYVGEQPHDHSQLGREQKSHVEKLQTTLQVDLRVQLLVTEDIKSRLLLPPFQRKHSQHKSDASIRGLVQSASQPH